MMFTLFLEFLDKPNNGPAEKDLTDSKAYKMLIGTWPKLEKQLKLAWNGDSRAMAKGEHKSQQGENVFLFPKILMVKNLQKYEPDFALTGAAKGTIDDLYKLFFEKFRIANKSNSNWRESKESKKAKI